MQFNKRMCFLLFFLLYFSYQNLRFAGHWESLFGCLGFLPCRGTLKQHFLNPLKIDLMLLVLSGLPLFTLNETPKLSCNFFKKMWVSSLFVTLTRNSKIWISKQKKLQTKFEPTNHCLGLKKKNSYTRYVAFCMTCL